MMQAQAITLPKILLIRRIGSVALGPRPIPTRNFEYARQLSSNGDTWEINGLVDRATLEQLFALQVNGTVWVTDQDRGNFHATIEVEAAWTADDCVQLERTT